MYVGWHWQSICFLTLLYLVVFRGGIRPVQTYLGKHDLNVTHLNGECFQNLVFNLVLHNTVFHNFKGYDGHLLMQAVSRVQGEIKCIQNNTEKYLSFSLGNLRFINRVNFLLSCLDSLVKGSDPQSFKITEKRHKDEEKRTLLLHKGIYYPYEYMECFERFGKAKFPA